MPPLRKTFSTVIGITLPAFLPLMVLAAFSDAANGQNPGVYQPGMQMTYRLGFVPGDAFFSVDSVSLQNQLLKDKSDGVVELDYRYPRVAPRSITDFHIYGFYKIRVEGFDEEALVALNDWYVHVTTESVELHRDDPRKRNMEHEAAEPSQLATICVVNRDFDLGERSLFLRYNENWKLTPAAAKEHPGLLNPNGRYRMRDFIQCGFSRYSPFIHNVDAVYEDWRSSSVVAPLNCAFPETLELKAVKHRYGIHRPVTVNLNDVAFVGIPGRFDDTRRQDQLNSTVYVLRDGNVQRFRWVVGNDGKCLREDSDFVSFHSEAFR